MTTRSISEPTDTLAAVTEPGRHRADVSASVPAPAVEPDGHDSPAAPGVTVNVVDAAPSVRTVSPELPPALTVTQAGQLLGVSSTRAYRAVHLGQLPTIRVGDRLLVPTAPLLEMLGIQHEVIRLRANR